MNFSYQGGTLVSGGRCSIQSPNIPPVPSGATNNTYHNCEFQTGITFNFTDLQNNSLSSALASANPIYNYFTESVGKNLWTVTLLPKNISAIGTASLLFLGPELAHPLKTSTQQFQKCANTDCSGRNAGCIKSATDSICYPNTFYVNGGQHPLMEITNTSFCTNVGYGYYLNEVSDIDPICSCRSTHFTGTYCDILNEPCLNNRCMLGPDTCIPNEPNFDGYTCNCTIAGKFANDLIGGPFCNINVSVQLTNYSIGNTLEKVENGNMMLPDYFIFILIGENGNEDSLYIRTNLTPPVLRADTLEVEYKFYTTENFPDCRLQMLSLNALVNTTFIIINATETPYNPMGMYYLRILNELHSSSIKYYQQLSTVTCPFYLSLQVKLKSSLASRIGLPVLWANLPYYSYAVGAEKTVCATDNQCGANATCTQNGGDGFRCICDEGFFLSKSGIFCSSISVNTSSVPTTTSSHQANTDSSSSDSFPLWAILVTSIGVLLLLLLIFMLRRRLAVFNPAYKALPTA